MCFSFHQVVLNTFEAQPLSDEEGNANNLEDEAATFNIKYLTSSKLMGLEVRSVIHFSFAFVMIWLKSYIALIFAFLIFYLFPFSVIVKRFKLSSSRSSSVPHIVWLSKGNTFCTPHCISSVFCFIVLVCVSIC